MPNVTFRVLDSSSVVIFFFFLEMSYKQRFLSFTNRITMHGRLAFSVLALVVVSSQQAIKNLYLSETQQFGR